MNARAHYASKKLARLADWHARKAKAQSETREAEDVETFQRAISTKAALDAELREIESGPDTFDCGDCGAEEEWGNHWLLPVRRAMPPAVDGVYPPAIELSHDVEIPICARCAATNPIIKVFLDLKAKLEAR